MCISIRWATAVYFAIGLGSSDAVGNDPQAPLPEVAVCKPLPMPIADTRIVVGHAEASQKVDIRPRISGYLTRINFKPGANVKKDEVLFEIDSRVQQAALEHAKAQVVQAEANVSLAKTTYERNRTLRDKGVISMEDVARADGELSVAKSALEAVRASLTAAELQLSFATIRSPIDGKIGRPNLDPGNLVQADVTNLATVFSTDPIAVAFDLDERCVLRLRRQRMDGKLKLKDQEFPVAIGLSDEEGFPHSGKIDWVNSEVKPSTGTVSCRALLSNSKDVLMPGMVVRVQLTTSDMQAALLIPKLAVISRFRESEKKEQRFDYRVFVLDENNAIMARPVSLRDPYLGFAVVSDGLKETDRVLWDASRVWLDDGMPATPNQPLRLGMVVKPGLEEIPIPNTKPNSKNELQP